MEQRLYIDKDGERYFLSSEQEASVRNQMRMQEAYSVLECFGCTNIDELNDETLLEIGYALEDVMYENVGDAEYSVLEQFSDILDLDDEEYGFDEVDDDESIAYENAIERLNNLELSDSDYDYYKGCLDDMYYADNISMKNGDTGYECYDRVIEDAERTANQ